MTLTEHTEPIDQEELLRAEAGRRRAIFGLVGAFLTVLIVIVVVQWLTDSEESADGKQLPELTFTTLDGEDFALSSIVGQPAVINFFASWCAPCRAEMPAFEQVHLANQANVQFVGVNTRETDINAAREVVDVTGVTYTVVLGDDGGEGSLYQHVANLGVMPTTAFVDETGTVVDVHEGILTEDDLASRLQTLFG